jgi:hypothetical protein
MHTRRLAFAFLALAACSRSADDAGIVLNVDTDVMTDRAVISRLAATVDAKRQEWTLTRPLPGSLGIQTSPGTKLVVVEGFAGTVLRGRWTGAILAKKGSVVVQDVHLAYVGTASPDGGSADVSTADAARDAAIDLTRRDVGGTGGVSGQGGTSGTSTLPVPLDGGGGVGGTGDIDGGGRGGIPGSGGIAGRDGGDAPAASGVDGADGPLPGDGPPLLTAPLIGAFAVTSPFEIPASAAAPGPVADALGLVHGFVVDPGAAILGFADDAGVAGLGTLRSVLPDALESRLTGWINDYIKTASVGGVTPYSQLVWLDDTMRALLLYWTLQSRLALPVGTTGTHSPVTLVFASTTGTPYSVPVDPTAQVTAGIGVAAVVSWPSGASGPAVATISDHFMGLPFGRYVLRALDAVLLAEHGAPTLATFLANAVGCPAMAAYVASQCVSIVCVGHESDLLDVCEGGLAEAARQIEGQITGLDFKAIHFQQGTAIAVGAQVGRPQDATALADGTWTASVDFGSGEQPATANFSAVAEAGPP